MKLTSDWLAHNKIPLSMMKCVEAIKHFFCSGCYFCCCCYAAVVVAFNAVVADAGHFNLTRTVFVVIFIASGKAVVVEHLNLTCLAFVVVVVQQLNLTHLVFVVVTVVVVDVVALAEHFNLTYSVFVETALIDADVDVEYFNLTRFIFVVVVAVVVVVLRINFNIDRTLDLECRKSI